MSRPFFFIFILLLCYPKCFVVWEVEVGGVHVRSPKRVRASYIPNFEPATSPILLTLIWHSSDSISLCHKHTYSSLLLCFYPLSPYLISILLGRRCPYSDLIPWTSHSSWCLRAPLLGFWCLDVLEDAHASYSPWVFLKKMVQRRGVSFMLLSFPYHLYLVHSVFFCACFLYIRNCMYL